MENLFVFVILITLVVFFLFWCFRFQNSVNLLEKRIEESEKILSSVEPLNDRVFEIAENLKKVENKAILGKDEILDYVQSKITRENPDESIRNEKIESVMREMDRFNQQIKSMRVLEADQGRLDALSSRIDVLYEQLITLNAKISASKLNPEKSK